MNLSALLLISMSPALLPGADRVAVGLTGTKKVIEASVVPGASSDVPTVLLIGGLNRDGIVTRELDNYFARKQSSRRFRLLAIPQPNPDKVRLVFPPAGRAYKENPESHYLWRWIGIEAPDLVVIAGESGVQYDAMDAQMAADLVSMARPVTKYATRVIEPSSVLRVLRRAAAGPPSTSVVSSRSVRGRSAVAGVMSTGMSSRSIG